MTGRVKTLHGTRGLSMREKAYRYIQQLIADGTLAAGGGISELLLAKELGSSRTPIREAMNQLAAEGLLDQSPSGGMVVAQMTRDDITELYELREALEVFAVGKIARATMRSADRDRLQILVDEIGVLSAELAKSKKKRLDPKQMERFLACDLGFHALLMSLAHNGRIQKVIQDTRLLISIFAIERVGHDAALLKAIERDHQRILDAVSAQKPGVAMAAIGEHIQASERERLAEFDQAQREHAVTGSLPAFLPVRRQATAR